MDAKRFDRIARSLTSPGTRRWLLARLAPLTLLGGLSALLDEDEAHGAGRRRRRVKRHKHGRGRREVRHKRKKNKKTCRPETPAETCSGKCGQVENTCKKTVDCGSCDCDVCASGCTHRTLQEAVDAANSGDTIRICAGTYTRDGTAPVARIVDKDLTLIGAGSGSGGTILDGGGVETFDPVLFFLRTTTHLRQLTVTGANGGPGISMSSTLFSETLTLADVWVTGNAGGFLGDGGGIRNNGSLTLDEGARVTGNTAQLGGGVYNGGTLIMNAGSSVAENTASDIGGGIFNEGGAVTLHAESSVNGNTAANAGGGVFNFGLDATLTLEPGSDLSGNFAPPGTPNDCADDSLGTSCP